MKTVNTKMNFYQFKEKMWKELTTMQTTVYEVLYSWKRKDSNEVFPQQTTIAKKANVSVRSVQRAIKELVKKGYITIEKRNKRIGNLNKYLLHVLWDSKGGKNKSIQEQGDNYIDDISNVDLDAELNGENEDSEANSKLIEGKTKLKKLTRWQKYVANKVMNMRYLLQSIEKFKKDGGRTFSYLIKIYAEILFRENLLTEDIIEKLKLDKEEYRIWIV